MAIMIQFDPTLFAPGGRLEQFVQKKAIVRYAVSCDVESTPHIAAHTTRDVDGHHTGHAGSFQVTGAGPTWFDSATEFNQLPYPEVRAQIANEVERGILQVIDSTGAVATAEAIRKGTVA
jgi:hypothetical protein